MRLTRLTARSVAVTAALLSGIGCLGGVAHAAPLPDSKDPFYRYDKPLTNVAPGTVLRTRQVNVGVFNVSLPVTATQVLYRTTKTDGAAVATVATILRPAAAVANLTQILSYQTAYDDLGSTCTPSYTIQGGNSSSAVGDLEIGFMAAYLAAGDTVVTSDYEGISHDYTAGQGAGYQTLDAIRAARTVLGYPDPTPVGLLGYSGGAIATEWASELAPSYAPETSIIGAAEGGIPVDYAHTVSYIDGSPSWASVIPWLFNGMSRAFDVDLTPYLSDKGKAVMKFTEDKCLATGSFPGLHIADMLKPGNNDYKKIRPLAKMIGSQLMGTGGTPHAPVLMGAGNADGIGDGIMISADVEALAHKYCQQGVPVRFERYTGLDHVLAIVPFEAQALTFLTSRFLGGPADNGCSSIGPGNSLTPLALPPLPTLTLGHVHHAAGHLVVSVRSDAPGASDVINVAAVSVYSQVKGKQKLLAGSRPGGTIATTPRALRLPLSHGVRGRSYLVTVRATVGGEKITGKAKFRPAH